jgi:Transglutaminase-like superfamily
MRRLLNRWNLPFKVRTAARVWYWFAVIALGVRRHPLPHLVERLRQPSQASAARIEPIRLGRIVQRALRLGRFQPRCIFTALVLYRLLHEQGDRAELVIGLPRERRTKDAHAWIELAGADIGPPPGRGDHQELVRYG